MKYHSQSEWTMSGGRTAGNGGLFAEGAQAWGFSSTGMLWGLWAIPVVIVLGAMVSALLGKPAYKWYTGEDQFAETMQVFFYLAAFVMCLMIIKHLWSSGQKSIAGLYMIVLLGLFFMIGEELSWGQRLVGWETSQAFQEINKQDETNLHNIHGVGSTFKWIQMLVGLYGTLLPLLLWKVDFFKRNEGFFSYVIPHFTLIPFFAPLFVWRLYRNLLDPPEGFYFVVSEFNEVMEFVLAAGMTLFMLYQWRRLKSGRA